MSLTLTLYKISKKLKSTKVPALTDPHIDLTVTLKDDTNVINPTFRLSTPATLGAIPYNYASIHLWGHTRYYRIRNLELRNDAVVAVHCVEDFLASWATDVKTSSQYVLRSSDTAICDLDIPDAAYIGKSNISVIHTPSSAVEQMLPNPVQGIYVIGFIADINNGANPPTPIQTLRRGAVAYLAFWDAEMKNLLQKMSALSGSLADVNPLSYVASCVYVPVSPNNAAFGNSTISCSIKFGTSTDTIMTGIVAYAIDESAAPLGLLSIFSKTNMQLPDHPQLSRGKYLNNAPYAYHHLYAGLFGDFDIKQDMIRRDADGKRFINCYASLDLATGDGVFQVWGNATPSSLYKLTAKLGVEVELAQKIYASTDQLFALGMQIADAGIGATGAAIDVITGDVGGAVSAGISALKGAANAAFSAYKATIPKLSTLGNNGGMGSMLMDGFVLTSTFINLSPEDIDHIGRPVMQNVSLATVAAGSLVICADTHMVIPALQEEIQMLEADMNGGFYLD